MVYDPAKAVIVVDRVVLGAAVVTEGDRPFSQRKRQINSARLASALAPSRGPSSRLLVTSALAGELTATSPSSNRCMPADKVS
jgi:hypothetical protein